MMLITPKLPDSETDKCRSISFLVANDASSREWTVFEEEYIEGKTFKRAPKFFQMCPGNAVEVKSYVEEGINMHLAKKALKKALEEAAELNVKISDNKTVLYVEPNFSDDETMRGDTIICQVKNNAKTREWLTLIEEVCDGNALETREKRFEMSASNVDKVKEYIVDEFKAWKTKNSNHLEEPKIAMSVHKASIVGTILGGVGKSFDIDSMVSPGGGVVRIKPHITVDGQKICFPYFVVVAIADGAQIMRVDYFRASLLGSESVLPATTVGTVNGLPIDYAGASSAADSIVAFFQGKVPDALEEVTRWCSKFLNPEPEERTQAMNSDGILHPNPQPEDGARRLEDYVPAAVSKALRWAQEHHTVRVNITRDLATTSTEVELFIREHGRLIIRIPFIVRSEIQLIFDDGRHMYFDPARDMYAAHHLRKIVQKWLELQELLADVPPREKRANPGCLLVIFGPGQWDAQEHELK